MELCSDQQISIFFVLLCTLGSFLKHHGNVFYNNNNNNNNNHTNNNNYDDEKLLKL